MALTAADLTQIKNWLENNIDVVKTFIKNHDLLEQQNAQIQAQAESDARRAAALTYIATLNLTPTGSTNAQKKTSCYTLMDFCRNEMNGKDGETRQELQKKIDALLVLANQFKDLQRLE